MPPFSSSAGDNSSKTFPKQRFLPPLFLALALVHGLLYLSLVPPWQAPDETGHFEYAWLIAQLGRLPERDDVSAAFERELLGSLYEWRYGEYINRPLPKSVPARMDDLPATIFARRSRTIQQERFSLNYLWAALFIRPVRHHDLVLQLYAARFSSVLLNVGIVWLAWRTFQTLLPHQPGLAGAMTAALVFLPQHTFINSAAGDGPLAELLAGWVLYAWVKIFCRGATIWEILSVAAGTAVGVWTKKTAAFLLPLDLLLAGWWLFRRPYWQKLRQNRQALLVLLLALGLLGGLLFLSPLGGWIDRSLTGWLQSPSFLLEDEKGLTLPEALMFSLDSFWANFGWMAVPLSGRWYGVLLLLAAAALAGWWKGDRDRDVPPWAGKLMGLAFLTAFSIFTWVALLTKRTGYFQYQGRYLFPVAVPVIFLLVGGWRRLWPDLNNQKLAAVTVAAFAFFDAWCVMLYLIPYFYAS